MKLRLAKEKYQSTQELKDNEKNQKQKDMAKKKYDDRVILNKRKLQVEFKQRKKPKIEKEKKSCDLTNEQWSALVPILFPRLFSIPHRLKKADDISVVTTHVHALRATVFLRHGMCHAMHLVLMQEANQSKTKNYEFLLQLTLDRGIMVELAKIVVLFLDRRHV